MATTTASWQADPDLLASNQGGNQRSNHLQTTTNSIPQQLSSWTQRCLREISIAVVLAVILLTLSWITPAFFRLEHLKDKLVANAPVLVAAIGMTLVILSRQIDISIGSQFSVCSVVAALLAQSGWPIPLIVIFTVICGTLLGWMNGWFVAIWGLPAIVVTLATMVIYREALRWWREGEFVRNLQDRWQWFGTDQIVGQWIIMGLACGVFLLMLWILNHTALGRSVYAVGSNQEAARLVGVQPPLVLLGIFSVMGALVGLAAVLNTARFGDIDPNSGNGLELQTIAAVVVGGTAVSGGRGTLWGTLLGVLLLGIIGPALVFLKIQPEWEKAIQGGIILAAVASEAWRKPD